MPVTVPSALLDLLRSARKVAVLTGAGTSAESGVPTFRDALTGLWERFRPEDLATPEAFLRNPKRVWEWYAWRRDLVGRVQPNPGHIALAELARRYESFTLITQNVDGLHQRAGSRNVIELHGNITRVKCFEQEHSVESWEAAGEVPPRCPVCRGRLRPDVVWFGESLPVAALERAHAAAQSCDVFFSIGTSGLVYPAAGLPRAALDAGKPVVEINSGETPLTRRATFFLAAPAGVALPELMKAIAGTGRRLRCPPPTAHSTPPAPPTAVAFPPDNNKASG